MIRTVHYLILGFSLFFYSANGIAQGHWENKKEKREEIHTQKIAFISDQLDLTSEEAQEFWPIYNEYETEIGAIRKKRKSYLKQLRDLDNLSGDKAYDLMQSVFNTEKEESDIRIAYLQKFNGALGKKKAAQVFIAEEKFKRELLKKIHHEGRVPPPDRRH